MRPFKIRRILSILMPTSRRLRRFGVSACHAIISAVQFLVFRPIMTSGIVSFAVTVGILGFYIFGPSIYIHDITLPESFIDDGEVPSTETRVAVARIESELRNRIANTIERPVGNFISIDGEAFCNNNAILFRDQQLEDVLLDNISEPALHDRLPNFVIASNGLSLSRVGLYIRRALFSDFVEIHPSIAERDGRLILSIAVESASGVIYHTERPIDRANYRDSLIGVLATIISPEISSLTSSIAELTAQEFLDIARIYDDPYRTALVSLHAIESLLNDRTAANYGLDALNAWLIAGQSIILIDELHELGKYRETFRLILLAAQAPMIRVELQIAEDDSPWLRFLDAMKQDLIENLEQALQESEKRLIDFFIYSGALARLGERDRASETFEEFLTNDESQESSLEIRLASILLSGYTGNTERTLQQINELRLLPEYPTLRDDMKAFVDTIEAYVRIKRNDFAWLRDFLSEGRLSPYPCFELSVINDLVNSLGQYDAQHAGHSVRSRLTMDMLALANSRLQHIENAGMANFSFFNLRGIVLTDLSRHADSYQAFERAMAFHGDHAWALLNWGWSARQSGHLDEAYIRFSESLSIGTVPAAVYGLLSTLSAMGRSEDFLNEAQRYLEVIERFDQARRTMLSYHLLFHSCLNDNQPERELFVSDELIAEEYELNPRNCDDVLTNNNQ